ncbi:PLP-dependent transferase [Ceraceosorus guamensis]|uniref:PLP-dependent transferase n=1 Tax=Ceraceosorus guamensis TaxID=1522189 RepID=A0A316W918_9BASI|nr:PLP-dependent transferase [Ceraceosorus guamensis]PWN46367.1 PLP-dependent transferase [Ceraceosorus guamensis]
MAMRISYSNARTTSLIRLSARPPFVRAPLVCKLRASHRTITAPQVRLLHVSVKVNMVPPVASNAPSSMPESRAAEHGPSSQAIGKAAKTSHVLHMNLKQAPMKAERAEGCYIYGPDGKRWLDACGGAAVVTVGHGNQRVVSALCEQLQTVNYCHSLNWTTDPSEELANFLCSSAPKEAEFERAYFASGGSEALESALKLAREHFYKKGEHRRINFVGRQQSYHGTLIGSLGVGGNVPRRAMYEEMLPSAFNHHVSPCFPYRYQRDGESDQAYVTRLEDELEAKFQELGPDTVAAFVGETVVGATTGAVAAVPGYWQAMRRVCDRHGALLIMDEIMSGMGRTGYLWAFEHEHVYPDIVTIAKGLNGGYAPLSAVLANRRVVSTLDAEPRGVSTFFTYSSWSVGARAALEVQRIIKEDNLVDQCKRRGVFLEHALKTVLGDHPHVGDIRGRGLFYGVEFVADRKSKEPFAPQLGVAPKVVEALIKSATSENAGIVLYPGKGTIDGKRGDHVLIAPPYTIEEAELTYVAEGIRKALDAVLQAIQ